ncbi:MAG: hypothetical protein IPL46_11190 [Saprospiraceae bacterium]|nr:hypothetical protein [Saprospiraceae bacterium]
MKKAKKRNTKSIPDKKDWITPQPIYILLFFLIIILYINTIGHGYVLDDAIVISENTFTKKGFTGLIDIFRHDTFYGFFQQEGKDKLVSGGRYRPLSQAMFAIEYGIFGPKPG